MGWFYSNIVEAILHNSLREKKINAQKCVIIAGKEHINDIRPKQNINKCL
jgi:hypothetical protein